MGRFWSDFGQNLPKVIYAPDLRVYTKISRISRFSRVFRQPFFLSFAYKNFLEKGPKNWKFWKKCRSEGVFNTSKI